MADGTCSVQAGGRAYSSSENESIDAAARERIAGASVSARRRADEEAETRTAAFIAGSTCGGGPSPSLQSLALTAQPETAGPKAAKDQQRIDAVVRPGHKDTFDGLTNEIVRLKKLSVAATDAGLRAAVTARIVELGARWMAKAEAEGVAPPTAGFNPYTATDRALRSAFLWTEVGGALPLSAAMTDGGTRFREDIFEAVAMRTPVLDTTLLASYRDQPGAERALLERDLLRLGDHSPCRVGETVEELRGRRAALLRDVDAKQAAIDGQIRWMGLDGRQGTFEQLVDHELEQRWLAMNPGTTTGAITATVATLRGGTTTEIRAAGQAGNAWQNVAGALGGAGDPRALGPGLGRRSRAPGMEE